MVEETEEKIEEFKPMNVGHAILREIMNSVEGKNRRQYAIDILNRAIKYVHGYLDDYDILVRRDFRGEPLKIEIQVWTGFIDEKSDENGGDES